MRILHLPSGCLILLCVALPAQGQGTFENLDFESANIAGYPVNSSHVPITLAIPGWSGFYGTNQTSDVWYDGVSLGGVMISVVDSNVAQYGFSPLQGKFSAALFGGIGGIGTPLAATISQTGLVPAGTKSLQAIWWSEDGNPVVTLGGQTINMVPLASYPTYTLYGGDISSFAGEVETLSITEPPPAQGSPSMLELDNIQFSDQAIPEPGVFGLFALGALVLIWRVLRRRG